MTIADGISGELVEIQNALSRIAKKSHTLELSLGPVSISTTYFQSVFVRVNSTAQLMQLNLDLKEAFDLKNSVFMPHISLVYGNHNMLTREKIAKEIKLKPAKFFCNQLEIVPNTQKPDSWKSIATVSLRSKVSNLRQ